MSLLEDVFLEDEAGEAQQLERVIEGDEYEYDRPRVASDSDDNSEKDDEATEDKRRVDPTKAKVKRVVKNPRFTLNPARLTGPRGIQVIPEHFKDFKFKGKGHEKEDLDLVLKKLEHWAYRLYPKFQFEDCLKKIETLGKKRPVMVHLHKIRSDQLALDTEETVVQKDSSDDEPSAPQEEDEFDKLLQQQIDIARATPAPGSIRKPGLSTPIVDKRSPLTVPKATSSPSINDEQKQRMIRNRQLAEERRIARLKQNSLANGNSIENNTAKVPDVITNENYNTKPVTVDLTDNNIALDTNEVSKARRLNKSHVIGSSDEESETAVSAAPITVDVHNNVDKGIIDITGKENPKKTGNDSNEVTIIDDVQVSKARKLNKSQIIDSSDDESETMVASESSVGDIHKNLDKGMIDITGEDNSKKTAKESSDVTVIDLVNNVQEASKVTNHISNVIDSSDEECDVMSVNQSISVDVHANENMKSQETVNNLEPNGVSNRNMELENDIVEDTDFQTNTPDKLNENKSVTENIEEDIDFNEKSKEIEETHNLTTIGINNGEIGTKNDRSKNTIETQSQSQDMQAITQETNETELNEDSETDIKENNDKQNDHSIESVPQEIVDEVMDVDFSDDF